MASRAAILRAARAGAPGAAQPTYPPQGGSPWIGQLPSYATEPGSGYSRPYGPFLPRPGDVFTQGAFGPLAPILPVPVDQPPPGFERAQPRRWQPYPGYNLPVGQPGTEGYKLASFDTLKTLAETYSILRTCIEIRKNEIRALDWDILPTREAAKKYQGDRAATQDFEERRAKAKRFMRRPDPNYYTFESWLHAMMDQVFTIDALSLYMCPKKGRGLGRGLLGSDLDCLWLINGASIRPLMGLHGEVPEPSAPGYQQYEFGVPRADLTMMEAGLDLNGDEGRLLTEIRGDQLMYHPYLQRVDSPYGFSLVEQALIPIMTGLRKQAYQLDYFSESSVPRVWLSPGDASMTPNQIRELQDAINAVAGDLAWAFKVMVVPPNSKIIPQKDISIVDDSDNWIATEVAMVCNISPVELGLIPKVSSVASPFAAREMAQASRSIHERTSTKPTLSYVASIFDFLLQMVCGQEDMRFVFNGMEETQDQAALTDMLVKQVQSGLKSIDEARDDLHLTPWNYPETQIPLAFTQMGPIPLDEATQEALSSLRQAITGQAGSPQAQQAVEAVQRHAAVTGQAPRKALPAGTTGQGRMNGAVTQRQARRGGALAPAHATAEGSPGHSGASPPKAALAELEALGRHLGRGMPVSEWVPEHIPGHVMATIEQDMAAGISVAYAVKMAASSLPKAPAAQSQQQQRRQAQQQAAQRAQQAALAAQHAAQLQAAFGVALAAAKALIAAWIAGTLAVTAAVLVSMILAELRKAMLPVLTSLWTDAWQAGEQSAGAPEDQAALQAFLDSWGEQWLDVISATGAKALQDAIRQALASGDPAVIAQAVDDLLSDARADTITRSEFMRAWNAAVELAMRAAGLAYKKWVTSGKPNVCPICRANAAQGSIPLDKPFKSGKMRPLEHPNCECHLEPGAPPPANLAGKSRKVLRREVGLNGQEIWTEWEPQPETTGGRVFYPHRADGAQYTESVPGAMTGGEPPRWDGSEPYPVVERAPDADDDAEYGEAAGIGARPGTYWPAPYMDGWWPAPHGQGMVQPPTSSPGSATGRPPNAGGKRRGGDEAVKFLRSAPHAKPGTVYHQMLGNFPPEALAWVKRIRWAGPVEVPLELIDTSGRDKWAARHQQDHVDDIARQLQAKENVNPGIGIVRAGHNHIRMIDGRHRLEACGKLGWPLRMYVGYLDAANEHAAYDTYLHQFHSGDDPANKSFTAGNLGLPGNVSGLTPFNLAGSGKRPKDSVGYRPAADLSRSCGTCSMFIAGGSCTDVAGSVKPEDTCDLWKARVPHARKNAVAPYVAGLAVRAADTGRVLMIQRAITDADPAAGLWEFPGGHADEGEPLFGAACREFGEETGRPAPPGDLTGRWAASNGIYEGFVVTIPREDDLDLAAPREVSNPDGDAFEAVAWWDPALLIGNPAIRPEILADLQLILAALNGVAKAFDEMELAKSALTPELASTHNALGRESLWHTPDRHVATAQALPDYIENIAHALERAGHSEQDAIRLAIAAVKRWARGDLHWGKGHVTPEVQRASAEAVSQWERLKESHH